MIIISFIIEEYKERKIQDQEEKIERTERRHRGFLWRRKISLTSFQTLSKNEVSDRGTF
jgi:hypothetical protein